ncbi:hypothetical protein L0U95_24110 (plasmid) [Burkholderia cenocepacia]|uniref:hypothetical protein n=1 Tax=Burkholderia cenocepacia TaxID=95486 RepID=UPI001F3954C6|nr:hypothetical protein [Burkholderia cenocepacia]UJH75025.1 hypothetical protein L0U95_24110 [Burkholderia cenocepacia]
MKTETVLHHLVGKTYKEVVDALSVSQDHGDCCGWSDHVVADCLKDLEEKDAAVLVNVVRIEYDESESDRVALNFIFDLGDKKGLILGHELSAGSGSGWNYGAYCTLRYDGEEIASASW